MLKKIDQADIDKLDESQRQHLMVNAEGEYVFAQADEKAWQKHLEQVKAAEAAQKRVQIGNKELQDRGLECSIDKRLFVDPMKTPCCGKTYCHDCIENALLDSDLTCPGCGTENISLEALKPDEEVKTKIKEYQDEKSVDKQRSPSLSGSVSTPKPDMAEETARPESREGSKSPASTNSQSKKRTADEANDKSPESLSAPAMKRQKSGEGSVPTEEGEQNKSATLNDSTNTNSNNLANMNMPFMPPDMSQIPNMGMNLPMMPMMNNMPFMPNMMNMMGAMGGMPNMMPNMMNMPGMNMNMNMNMNSQFPTQNQNHNQNNGGGNWNQHKNNQYRNKARPFQQHNHQQQPQQSQPPEGMKGVPTGPKALQKPGNQGGAGGFNPPSGPAATKFSNQQRYTGKEEDNAYVRQPLNPQRQWQKNKRGRVREPDYKEL
jgi:protein MPE1